jgi:GDP-L-fucose synthase
VSGAISTGGPTGRTDFDRTAKVYVAGHRGLVGSAIVRRLEAEGYTNLVTRTSAQLDLRDQAAVQAFFAQERPELVFLAAAKVGGILANSSFPAQFIYDNTMIAMNVINAAHDHGVRKLLNLGSSCIYPRLAEQPLREAALLTGPLEETNRAYAVAKIAAIELCDAYRTQYGDDFVSAMPTNLYGPGDNFDLQGSHVLPALLRKVVEAKERSADAVEIWGSGTPLREFLCVGDLAEACLFIVRNVSMPGPINVGTGQDVTIRELADVIADVVGYQGSFRYDATKPDGTPRKLMDVSLLASQGWTASTGLRQGIERTLAWYLANRAPDTVAS